MNLKVELVKEYKERGVPISLDEFKESNRHILEKSPDNIENMPQLDDVYGLSFEQLEELINYYGSGFLFNDHIESLVKTRYQITSIEKKR